MYLQMRYTVQVPDFSISCRWPVTHTRRLETDMRWRGISLVQRKQFRLRFQGPVLDPTSGAMSIECFDTYFKDRERGPPGQLCIQYDSTHEPSSRTYSSCFHVLTTQGIVYCCCGQIRTIILTLHIQTAGRRPSVISQQFWSNSMDPYLEVS